ncbi:hypothetical protein [Microbacterium sp. NPDC090003]|uniref:hypothetical protein n=1 Tax=Microbacterium sp. NPDC090003 TaxID=3364203 RepID=UPI0037F1F64D
MNADDELRSLQARAYRRGGGLDAHDAERLDELTRNEAENADAPALRPSSPRRRWVPLATALIAGVLIGGTAVWALSGPTGGEPVTLTAEQQEWQEAVFAEDGFDGDSARPLTVVNDVVAWTATKGGGEWTCLVLGHAEHTVAACNPTADVQSAGLSASLTTDPRSDQATRVAVDLAFDGSRPSIRTSATDRALAPGGPWSADEESDADSLVEQGLERESVRIVGSDDAVTVWVGENTATGETCLVAIGDKSTDTMCDVLGDGARSGLGLTPSGGASGATYTFTTGAGGESLAVTRQPSGGGLG